MPAVTNTSTPAGFELKSAALTLLAFVPRTSDLAQLAAELERQAADTPGLFDQEPALVDLSAVRDAEPALDLPALAVLLRRYGLRPVAARGGTDAQMAAAQQAGLALAPESLPPPRPRAAAPAAEPLEAAPPLEPPAAVEPAPEPVVEASTEPAPEPAAAPAPAARTLIIDRPLRSGQQVYARGGDLVVLAVVSFGAEVIADGSIHVYAPLRGRAVAGARGDTGARIFAASMEPQLVSIAGTYRTIETPLAPDVLGKPAQVRLDGDRLVIEALKP